MITKQGFFSVWIRKDRGLFSRSKLVKVDKGLPLRIGIIALSIGTVGVLIGTTIFFSN
jgi:hypothetical protein